MRLEPIRAVGLKLWDVRRIAWDYDENDAMLVVARSADEAQRLAHEFAVKDRGKDKYHNSCGDPDTWRKDRVMVNELDISRPGVIFEDFHPG